MTDIRYLSHRNKTTKFVNKMTKRIQIWSYGRVLTLSQWRDMGKSKMVEEQESLQTAGSQQGTDVRLHYCPVRSESLQII